MILVLFLTFTGINNPNSLASEADQTDNDGFSFSLISGETKWIPVTLEGSIPVYIQYSFSTEPTIVKPTLFVMDSTNFNSFVNGYPFYYYILSNGLDSNSGTVNPAYYGTYYLFWGNYWSAENASISAELEIKSYNNMGSDNIGETVSTTPTISNPEDDQQVYTIFE